MRPVRPRPLLRSALQSCAGSGNVARVSMPPPHAGRRVSTPPGPVSDAELATRRDRLLDDAERLGLDTVLVYGANRSGSAVPWLTCWQVSREAVVVLRRGAVPVLLVGFRSHVPNARRV